MILDSPAVLPAGALQPRVEPEIGLRLARRLTPPFSVESVLDACDAALACLEIVDSVWSGYQFTLEDNTADGSSAAWVAAGPSLPLSGLESLPVDAVGGRRGGGERDGRGRERPPGGGGGVARGAARRARALARAWGPGHHGRIDQSAGAGIRSSHQRLVW